MLICLILIMNETETRDKLINPKLLQCGWDVSSRDTRFAFVKPEFVITKPQLNKPNSKALYVDYVLSHKGKKVAVIEAKKVGCHPTEGLRQAKKYAEMMNLRFAYCTNGERIYLFDMQAGKGEYVDSYMSPDELYDENYPKYTPNQLVTIKENSTQIQNLTDVDFWKNKFNSVIKGSKFEPRYYQENAINNTLDAIAEGHKRALLTLATGTGKTVIAFELAWKLFNSRWNLNRDSKRQPRILFLSHRNILTNQAFNSFSEFDENCLVRIKPEEIRKKGKVPKNGNVFFTIFQTFVSGEENKQHFGQYDKDFFDLIIVDECHAGGANDESSWRLILEYFSPAVQIGLTATPKRDVNGDTYDYFGKPVYTYSLKQGIEDGFLTPFRVKSVITNFDEYSHSSTDKVVQGEVEEGKTYKQNELNKKITVTDVELYKLKLLLKDMNQEQKTIIFCKTQRHALDVVNVINDFKDSNNSDYCVRVTADDGKDGEYFLEQFQDDENSIPIILTTSRKLSTGVDCKNVRNIVLMREVSSMVEFKQIIGRGTRLFEGKKYFTIYDFEKVCSKFNDPEWDGEIPEPETVNENSKFKSKNYDLDEKKHTDNVMEDEVVYGKPKQIIIELSSERRIQIDHIITTTYLDSNGNHISFEKFLQNLYGELPDFFKSETELRKIWSNPKTREDLLIKLENSGYNIENLKQVQEMLNQNDCDLLDVLEFISFNKKTITRKERVKVSEFKIFNNLNTNEKDFIQFILDKYIEQGVLELNNNKLVDLINLKYNQIADANKKLGDTKNIRKLFIDFQKDLYLED